MRKLPSGQWQARYRGPDGKRRSAPVTFGTKRQADAWLSVRQSEVERGTWQAPEAAEQTLAEYAEAWLAGRDLRPRTVEHYANLLAHHILPTLGGYRLDRVTATVVRQWHSALGASTGPTARAHAYGLLRTILGTAVMDDVLPNNPCRVRGGGSVKRASRTEVPSVEQVAALTDAMPDRHRAMVVLAAWCGLRYGEITELRRSDLNLMAGTVSVTRAVVRVPGGYLVGPP